MCLSTIALGRRWIDRGDGINANLYLMLVGDSSVARKSTSVRYAKKMIDQVDPTRIGPSDYTMEGLMKWMGEPPDGMPKSSGLKQNRVMLFSEEFGSDLARMEAYGPTLQADFCKLYDGESFSKVRVASAPLTVVRPRVGLFAAAAYQMLQKYLDAGDWTNGFLMRFLFVAPLEMREKFSIQPRFPQWEWDQARDGLTTVLNEMMVPNPGGSVGHHLSFDAQAEAAILKMQGEFDALLPGLAFIQQTYVERFKTNVQKLALLYQIDEDATAPIGQSAMAKAIVFAYGCWASFTTAHEKTTAGEFDALAQMVKKMMQEHNGFIPVRTLASRFPYNRQVLKVIEYLTGTGLATRKKQSIGGIPVDVLELVR